MPYGGGQSGMGGTSGMIMSLPEHNEELVTVVREKKARRRDINIVSPFAGKTFCFSEWKKSFGRLPVDRGHVVIYDNSNDKTFGRKLEDFCTRELPSYKLVRDTNPHLTMEFSNNWTAIGKRCRAVYGIIYNELIDHRKPWSLNLEDDVGIPEDSWEKLSFIMKDESVGTAIGKCIDRRGLKDRGIRVPIAVNFTRTQTIGPTGVNAEPKIELEHIPEKDFGVEAIGGGHMGLWLTRTEAINRLGMGHQFGDLCGNDMNWGYAINEDGWKFAHDWSIHMKHFYKSDKGKKLSC